MKQPLSKLTQVGSERRSVTVYQKPSRIWVAVGSWRSQAARIGKSEPAPLEL